MKYAFACILFSVLSLKIFSQWNPNPDLNNIICEQPQDQQDARIVGDAKGGGIISWVDFRNDQNESKADIYAQRVNSNGNVMWTNNGVAVCTNAADQTAPVLTSDGIGGTIIAWQDWRSGNRDIYAQRIDSTGAVLWTANGVAVVEKNSHQRGPRIVSDGAQGAVIVWEDSINGNWDIFVQHINAFGAVQWTSGGVAVCTAAGDQINPRVTADATGSFYVAWQDKRNGNDYDIYCQKLNASGAAQWTTNGISVSNATNSQLNPKIAIDNAGYLLLAWQHYNTGAGNDVYAQRVNSSGAVQWTVNGVQVCAINGNQSAIDITTQDITDGALITWKDGRMNNVNIYCQKIGFSGTVQWTANGVLLSNAERNQVNPNIVGDGNGGGIIVWQDSIAGIWDVYAQRISSTGSVMWTNGGVAVGVAAENQTSPKNVSDGSGGCLFSFQDKRSGDFDIYAWKLSSNGAVLGIENSPQTAIGISVYPNPFTATTTVYFPHSNSNLRLFDLTGREILSVYNITTNDYVIEKGNKVSGPYLLNVTSGKSTFTKLIIIN